MELWRIPLDRDHIQTMQGVVYILDERCKGCGYCIEFCPKKVLGVSKHFNRKGYHPPIVKHQTECVNCHFCEIICPEFAIYSKPLSVTESQNPQVTV
ncbi:MAG: 4Fe-4S dicluster domain-containing protein [Desulfobacterales bacterium]|nr:4Fe-4S dicluster domain-containing protein [Desulfobacterales bacterium]